MNKYGYVSGMADEMTLYIDYKVRSGFMEKSYIHRMRKFDRFPGRPWDNRHKFY